MWMSSTSAVVAVAGVTAGVVGAEDGAISVDVVEAVDVAAAVGVVTTAEVVRTAAVVV